MQSIRKIIRCVFLIIGLLAPLLGYLFFPDIYATIDYRINDFLFGIRFAFLDNERISPYLTVINIDDDFTGSRGYGASIGNLIHGISDNPHMPALKTVLVDLRYPEKIEMPADIESRKIKKNAAYIVTPVLISHPRRESAGESNDDPLMDVGFTPAVSTRGDPVSVDPQAESAKKTIDIEYPNTCAGITGFYPDDDGVVRRLPLVFKENGESSKYYLSFVLAAICNYCDVKPNNIEIKIDFGNEIVLKKANFRSIEKDIRIPIDDRGRMIVNFPDPSYSSFFGLSASKLLTQDDTTEEKSAIPAMAGIAVIGDVSTVMGKTGVYDRTEYPGNPVLASALNTILTENFLRPAGVPETLLLYLPAIALLLLFFALASDRNLKFFAIGLPVTYCSILLLTFLTSIFLFVFLHVLPHSFPVYSGLPITLFLLVCFHLFYAESESMYRHAGSGADMEKPAKGERFSLPDEKELRERLGVYNIVDEPQATLALYLLDMDLSLKEIADKLGICTQNPVNTLQSRIQDIYKKCSEDKLEKLNRLRFIKKILSTTDYPDRDDSR